jgi:hypothetical protein
MVHFVAARAIAPDIYQLLIAAFISGDIFYAEMKAGRTLSGIATRPAQSRASALKAPA